MSGESLLVTEGPVEPIWELDWQSLGAEYMALLGWTMREPSRDAGLSPCIASLLARACCRVATVSFLSSAVPADAGSRWRAVTAGAVCRLSSSGFWHRREFPFLATRDEQVAVRVFEDSHFQWTLCAQVILLSRPSESLPALEWARIHGLFERPVSTTWSGLRNMGVTALMLPGVDGDVAGLYCTESFGPELLDGFQAACASSGVSFERVGEGELRERLVSTS